MKFSKRISLFLLLAVLVTSFSGCFMSSPKNVITKFLDTVKSSNEGSFNNILNGTIDKDDKSEITFQIDNYSKSTEKMEECLKKISYSINSETVDKNNATVNVTINGPDFAGVMADYAQKAMKDNIAEEFSDDNMKDNEQSDKNDDRLSELLDNIEYSDRSMDIDLVKKDGKWQIKDKNNLVKLMLNIDPASMESMLN